MPAARRVAGIRIPAAPNNSNTPLNSTAALGPRNDGRHDAHFHLGSAKCATPPIKNHRQTAVKPMRFNIGVIAGVIEATFSASSFALVIGPPRGIVRIGQAPACQAPAPPKSFEPRSQPRPLGTQPDRILRIIAEYGEDQGARLLRRIHDARGYIAPGGDRIDAAIEAGLQCRFDLRQQRVSMPAGLRSRPASHPAASAAAPEQLAAGCLAPRRHVSPSRAPAARARRETQPTGSAAPREYRAAECRRDPRSARASRRLRALFRRWAGLVPAGQRRRVGERAAAGILVISMAGGASAPARGG